MILIATFGAPESSGPKQRGAGPPEAHRPDQAVARCSWMIQHFHRRPLEEGAANDELQRPPASPVGLVRRSWLEDANTRTSHLKRAAGSGQRARGTEANWRARIWRENEMCVLVRPHLKTEGCTGGGTIGSGRLWNSSCAAFWMFSKPRS